MQTSLPRQDAGRSFGWFQATKRLRNSPWPGSDQRTSQRTSL